VKSRSIKRNIDNTTFNWVVVILLILVVAAVLIPLWYVVIVSLTPLSVNQLQGYNLLLPPNQWSLEAYKQLLGQDAFIRALLNSCIITISGVTINMILTTLTAYALTFKDLPGRNIFLSLILFTFLFNAGIIPTYLVVQNLNLLNTYPAVILPGAISVYNLFVMKTFFQNLPTGLRESAIMDGANELQVLWHIV
jgi:putative aldouronate transport system permease protein